MKIDKVRIEVHFGNEGMQTEMDLADALIELARRIKAQGLDKITKVMDKNGNSVGTVN